MYIPKHTLQDATKISRYVTLRLLLLKGFASRLISKQSEMARVAETGDSITGHLTTGASCTHFCPYDDELE